MRPRTIGSDCELDDDSTRAASEAVPRLHLEPAGHHLLLTTEETAALLRTTRKAVYALIERRQIPGVVRLGRRVLVRSDVLLDWLQRQESKGHRLRGEER